MLLDGTVSKQELLEVSTEMFLYKIVTTGNHAHREDLIVADAQFYVLFGHACECLLQCEDTLF